VAFAVERWSSFIDIEGVGLDSFADVEDVDCAAPGECAVAGTDGYVDSQPQGLLAVLSEGTWTMAVSWVGRWWAAPPSPRPTGP
jgi:hypothetical protein